LAKQKNVFGWKAESEKSRQDYFKEKGWNQKRPRVSKTRAFKVNSGDKNEVFR